ncbi:type II toxin-antitoxin system RelE/ParE family toxin [Dyella caseinilytica]|uniref:Type II toxin-antitoxin system RelE/ParE family toxin n=2 Tax=Dyella caseinilytica TaxID=1849581 RepID=A0ABX7GVH9_9GAMM|nr:type II toxin-antitoxin system RelE/ParE family toxin [Dyella caseinilytica]QRN53874.1 type II toxin-antitoxin system RelE/ParE family toxin [Dyella caseinilytica]
MEIVKSRMFDRWLRGLNDRQAKARIQMRIDRLNLGNPGQHRNLTGGIREMKIDYGPGYRVYYTIRGAVLIILLCGGDKTTQQQDIDNAIRLADAWED